MAKKKKHNKPIQSRNNSKPERFQTANELEKAFDAYENGTNIYSEDSEAKKLFEKKVESFYFKKIKVVRNDQEWFKSVIANGDFKGSVLKRRILAQCRLAPVFKERYQNTYSNFDYETEVFRACTDITNLSYDEIEKLFHPMLGATLWIIGEIDKAHKMDRLASILDFDIDDLEIERMYQIKHLYYDSCYPSDMINHVYGVLYMRNYGMPGNDVNRFMTDDYVAVHGTELEGKDPGTFSVWRERYEKIIGLIPEESIISATQDCKDLLLRYVDMCMKNASSYYKQIEELTPDGRKCIADFRSAEDKLFNEIDRLGKEASPKRQFPSLTEASPSLPFSTDYLNRNNGSIFGAPIEKERRNCDEAPAYLDSLLNRVKSIGLSLIDINNRFAQSYQKIVAFGTDLTRINFVSYFFPEELYHYDKWTAEERKSMKRFKVPDPYRYSFALFYLLDTNDDYAWLYNPSNAVHVSCALGLPWNIPRASHANLFFARTEETEDALQSVNRAQKHTYSDKTMNKNYSSHIVEDISIGTGVKKDTKINYSQLIYSLTGVIPPRYPTNNRFLLKELEESGVPEENRELVLQCLGFAQAVKKKEDLEFTVSQRDAKVPLESDERDQLQARIEELESKVKEVEESNKNLKEENRTLTQDLYDKQKEAANLVESLAQNKKEAENDYRELVSLREAIFIRENGEEEEEEVEEPSIQFPYSFEKKIVSFGGHDSWRKGIKQMFEGVVFVDRDTLPNETLVKNADEIWIQPNAISHKYYYRIQNVVKRYNIPVRYFKYSSPIKCAEQMVYETQNASA